ncbi:diguanylate cyclase [Candidatus Aerophobetes bacterium]|nr:diguanylate cyclase [Candidatus Aerophobetes bacterium]
MILFISRLYAQLMAAFCLGISGVFTSGFLTRRKRWEKLYQTIFEISSVPTAVLNEGMRIYLVNAEFEKFSGYLKEEIENKKDWKEFVAKDDWEKVKVYHFTRDDAVSRSYEFKFINRQGEIKDVLATISVIWKQGRKNSSVVYLLDITERKQKEKEISYVSTHDVLTGLPNRWLFNNNLAFAIAHARRNQERLAVISFDLDNFEQVNNKAGYRRGDNVLQGIVDRIKATMRESDILARMGGDEFALILPGIIWMQDAVMATKRILNVIQKPFILGGHQFCITASAGIAVFPADGEDSDTLFKHSEVAMYSVRASSSGKYQPYTQAMLSKSLTTSASEQKQIVRDMQYGIATLEKVIKNTIFALTRMVETKDPYTAAHQRRVAKLAGEIAKKMGLLQEQVNAIYIASMIHDIGKVHIPGEILSKPGKLADSEFNMIKMHCEFSCEIIKGLEFPWQVSQIILQHHERMNGSGYPQKLRGKDILLEAKILAVADVVEAMSSHRPYRPALGIEKALEEISKNQAKLYDEDVVDACLELFTKEKFQLE